MVNTKYFKLDTYQEKELAMLYVYKSKTTHAGVVSTVNFEIVPTLAILNYLNLYIFKCI